MHNIHPVRSHARDKVASPDDRGAATSNGARINPVSDKKTDIFACTPEARLITNGINTCA
jgi:hypothetical protein